MTLSWSQTARVKQRKQCPFPRELLEGEERMRPVGDFSSLGKFFDSTSFSASLVLAGHPVSKKHVLAH